jgi:chromosome segregation ATPase
MKQSSTLALALGAALGLAACGKNEAPQQKATLQDVKKNAQELAASVTNLAQQTKEAFVANAEKELADMNGKIEALKSRAAKAQGDAKAKLDLAIAQLDRQRQAAADKLKAIKDAGDDAWKDMASGFASAWQELKKGYDAAQES